MVMCLYPRIIKNPKYRANKKNGGNIPYMADSRVGYIPVGCGMCMECMKQKANNWRIRIAEDIKTNTNGKFITLTYSNESYEELAKEIKAEGYLLDNEIARISVRRFLEKWRKEHKKSVRHWLITELGQTNTEHLHIHGIIWTDDVNEIEKHWKYGWVWKGKPKNGKIVNYVNESTANYITKYITKLDPLHKYYKPKILCSAGIGSNYVNTYNYKRNEYKEEGTKTEYITRQGDKMALPIYLRNKRYSEDERERLWIEKLNENKRYVGGECIDADNEEEYYKLLKYYRERNKELGYGSPDDWDAMEYEHERRKLKQDERMEKRKGVPPNGVS